MVSLEVGVLVSSAGHVDSLVEGNPVNLVMGGLELPVHEAVGGGVPVADGVHVRNQSALFADIYSKVRVRLIVSAAIG